MLVGVFCVVDDGVGVAEGVGYGDDGLGTTTSGCVDAACRIVPCGVAVAETSRSRVVALESGSGWRGLRRRTSTNQATNARSMTSAAPPIVPPTMAAVLLVILLVDVEGASSGEAPATVPSERVCIRWSKGWSSVIARRLGPSGGGGGMIPLEDIPSLSRAVVSSTVDRSIDALKEVESEPATPTSSRLSSTLRSTGPFVSWPEDTLFGRDAPRRRCLCICEWLWL